MTRVLITILAFVQYFAHGQYLEDTFKVGNYLEVFNGDSMKVYLNCTGTVVDKRCAKFYRVGKLDSLHINFIGNIADFNIDGSKLMEAKILDNYLEGKATYYYQSGAIKSVGKYKRGKKKGPWVFYYENGQIEKVANYVNGEPLIANYNKENGKAMVVNGNGTYKGEFYSDKNCTPFKVKGEILNGKMHGRWSFYNAKSNIIIGDEYFEQGKFVRGVSHGFTYTEFQKIFLELYCVQERVHLDANFPYCPGDAGIHFLSYKGFALERIYYPNLQDSISEFVNEACRDQWLLVGIKIKKYDEVENINIKSSIDDKEMELKLLNTLSSMTSFYSSRINKEKVDIDLFFTILIKDGFIVIPRMLDPLY